MKKNILTWITVMVVLVVFSPLKADRIQCGAGKCGSGMSAVTLDTKLLHKKHQKDGYDVLLTSQKPLVVGNNAITVTLSKANKPVDDVKVKIKFFMPEMPGMPYMEYKTKLKKEKAQYKGMVNFSMGGTWQYQLKFKDNAGKVHTIRGSVNL